MNAIIGAVILVVVIAIYITVSYFYGRNRAAQEADMIPSP